MKQAFLVTVREAGKHPQPWEYYLTENSAAARVLEMRAQAKAASGEKRAAYEYDYSLIWLFKDLSDRARFYSRTPHKKKKG